jgi:hypothetical protein
MTRVEASSLSIDLPMAAPTMLGARFLDVDFMRINLVCVPTV